AGWLRRAVLAVAVVRVVLVVAVVAVSAALVVSGLVVSGVVAIVLDVVVGTGKAIAGWLGVIVGAVWAAWGLAGVSSRWLAHRLVSWAARVRAARVRCVGIDGRTGPELSRVQRRGQLEHHHDVPVDIPALLSEMIPDA